MNIKNVIFIDLHSRDRQHLSGNISFIKNCINYLQDISHDSNQSYYYYCHKSSYQYAKNWAKELKITNLKITNKYNIDRDHVIIYLYPEYKDILLHLYLKLRGNHLIAVSHGHLNSFYNEKQKGILKIKRKLKTLFFSNFKNIICYSNHIKQNSSHHSPKIIHRKLSVISEIINTPLEKKSGYNFDNTNSNKIKIAFFRSPVNKLIKKTYERILLLENIELIDGSQYSIKSQKDYFKFIINLDIIILDKIHDYQLQVSGIVNDCIAHGTIPIGTKLNRHLIYLNECGLLKNHWNLEDICMSDSKFPNAEDIKEFKLKCIKWINIAQRNNKSEFLRIIKNPLSL